MEKNRQTTESDPSPQVSSDAATLLGPNIAGRNIGLAGDGTTRLDSGFPRLLQSRLRAGALVLFVGFGLYLLRNFIDPRPLWLFHLLVVACTGVCFVILSPRRSFTARTLRILELVVFGLPFLFFVPYQHAFMLQKANAGSEVLTLAAFKSVASYWLVTEVFYGLIIPNNWRRAAAIIGPLSCVPPLTALYTSSCHPLVAQVVTWDQFSDALMVLVIGSVCCVIGAQIMYELRREAIEARKCGQYQLIRQLGEGGMGQVYLAEHQLLKRPCAVKLIHPWQAGDPAALARFEREVQATAKLAHWNVIEIFDYGRTDDGAFYYVMEYLNGLSLDQLVGRYGPLPPGRVVGLIRQLCSALAHAHTQGLVHRDIKPGNLIVLERGGTYDLLKLLDFGLVKPVADSEAAQLTRAGALAGTPQFMAPEQCTGATPADARCDIYAVGGVAYFLLTGRMTFQRASVVETLMAVVRDPVEPPRQHNPNVPEDLEKIILRCLEKKPEARWPSAGELAEALAASSCAEEWTEKQAKEWWANRAHDPQTPSRAHVDTASMETVQYAAHQRPDRAPANTNSDTPAPP